MKNPTKQDCAQWTTQLFVKESPTKTVKALNGNTQESK